jgi:hypothetical protein
MVDNVAITAGSGTSIATDDVGGVHYQRFKLDVGADGAAAPVIGGVALPAGSKSVVISVTPTLDTSAYASGDSLHTTVLSFANAVGVSGGTGILESVVISDHDVQSAAGELWLFSATVTPAAANAAHSISDAHADLCVGVVPFGPYYTSALNSISVARPALPIACAATTLFGILVTRGTPTYTASGLVVRLQISQD